VNRVNFQCSLKNMKRTDGGVVITVGATVRVVVGVVGAGEPSWEPGGIGAYAIISSY